MKLPHFLSRKKFEQLRKQDEQVFAEASEFALLRLEQCIADLRLLVPPADRRNADSSRPSALRKYTDLF